MKAWQKFIKNIENKLGKDTADKWLGSLKIITFDACNLYLEAENFFQIKWFEEHIRPLVKKDLLNENFHPIKVHLSLTSSKKQDQQISQKENLFEVKQDSLDPTCTFENFISSDKNSVVHKLLEEVCTQNSSVFNPIFIYGPIGSGRSHLLMATANQLKQNNKKVFYVNAQTFTDHVVEAIRFGKMQEFRNAYRNADVLIVDDLHVFSNKNATQEEFFHTFNTLHSRSSIIILGANHAPSQLTDIEPRLISRFEWGISLGLELLKKEDLKKALKKHSDFLKITLNKEIESFLLENFKNISSLKKAIKTVALNLHLENKLEFSILDIQRYLSNLIEEENKNVLTPDKIIDQTAIYFGLRNDDILGKSQTRECTMPRQFSMYLCRELLRMPFMKIGKYFKRDHSTVITSIKAIQKQIDTKNADIHHAFLDVSKKLSR